MRRVIAGTINFLRYLNKPFNSNQAGYIRMNRNLIVLILLTVFVAPVMADKPEWAGQGKPTDEQKVVHKSAMEAKGDSDDDDGHLNEKKQKKKKKEKSSKLKGIEKQSVKKSEQEQKELERGSDKGKASREENRKKWWRVWGE